MAEFIYTTSTTVKAPVLIDADKLEALDNLIEAEYKRLHERLEKKLDTEVRERMETKIRHLERLGLEGAEFEKAKEQYRQEVVRELQTLSIYSLKERQQLT